MTTTPYWPAAEDWTGFLLVIVPVGPLPVPAEELCRQVRAQIETDPVLYDLVTVGLTEPLDPSAGWSRTLLTGVVKAAMPDGHLFAPRGLIGVVAVSDDREKVERAYHGFGRLPREARLWTSPFGLTVRPDSHTGVSPASVDRLVQSVTKLVGTFDEHPQAAMAEALFLDRVADLISQNRVDMTLRRTRPPTREPQRTTPPAGEADRPLPRPRPKSREEAVAPRESPVPAPAAQPVRGRLEPVMYEGAEIVTVDKRTTVQRLMRQQVTDADCLDGLQRDGRPVGLVHLIFVPDDGPVDRALTKRRYAIALELDQLFSTVERDAHSGRPAQLAVDVFSAANPVQKHGVLRPAGEATEAVLPKVKIEYFSVSETLVSLLDAAERTSRAVLARDLDVANQHFVFLAALRFPIDETTIDDWVDLLEYGRVTWIDFGTVDRRPLTVRVPPSPFGLHVLTDKEDVLTIVRKHCEVLYRYSPERPPAHPEPTARDERPVDDLPADGRRWWPFGRRATE
jgi:hypothetical protein